LVIAYALAGRVDIDFETEPLGHDADNKPVFLADIWPTRKEIQVCSNSFVMKYILYFRKDAFIFC
jgi:aconitate hydratase